LYIFSTTVLHNVQHLLSACCTIFLLLWIIAPTCLDHSRRPSSGRSQVCDVCGLCVKLMWERL